MTTVERRTVHFSGRVQGVGFRYATLLALQGMELSGYVMNLPDGRVELVLEGSAEANDEALRRVREFLGSFIAHESCRVGEAAGTLGPFRIRR